MTTTHNVDGASSQQHSNSLVSQREEANATAGEHEPDRIVVQGAREHNLKNVNLNIPRDAFIVFTGLSGSGKSSLAFDTIFAEGQRRYIESLSSYARMFLGRVDKPSVDFIEGLSPAVSKIDVEKPALHRRHNHRNSRLYAAAVGSYRCATLSRMW